MGHESNISSVASLLADSSRAAMIALLMDGRHHPAGELAAAAAVTPQTASFHLSKMVETGIVMVEKHGRHRYYRIGRQEDAVIIEQILTLVKPVEVRSLRESVQMRTLRHARFCYDHLAGQVAVAITESMVAHNYLHIEGMDYIITESGEPFFKDLGIHLKDLRKKRRSFSRCCLDWTERKYHLAGSLGHALTDHLFQLQWLIRHDSGRGVHVTKEGEAGIYRTFGIDLLRIREGN
jgi:DNA-binding transcriptional ArsR family regulator